MPKDPYMLLSFVNTQLRDTYNSLSDLCQSFQVKEREIIDKLSAVDYDYDEKLNQFV